MICRNCGTEMLPEAEHLGAMWYCPKCLNRIPRVTTYDIKKFNPINK